MQFLSVTTDTSIMCVASQADLSLSRQEPRRTFWCVAHDGTSERRALAILGFKGVIFFASIVSQC